MTTLGNCITTVCSDKGCKLVSNTLVKRCIRYPNPDVYVRGDRFMCPSQPIKTNLSIYKVRVGQQKTKRNNA